MQTAKMCDTHAVHESVRKLRLLRFCCCLIHVQRDDTTNMFVPTNVRCCLVVFMRLSNIIVNMGTRT